MIYRIDINPVSKPRMVHSDKWKKRDCTGKYWGFKKEFVAKCRVAGLITLPERIKSIDFFLKMPPSWNYGKQLFFDASPHQQKPDLDNLFKAVADCLCKDDQHIYYIGRMAKYWSFAPHIVIEVH